MKKKIAASVAVLLLVAAGLIYEFVLVLPPPEQKSIPGEKAPDFSLAATTGGSSTLAELTKGHSAVLVFYRGDW